MAELKEMCSEMGQSTTGGKAALIERILTKLQAAGEEEEEEEEEEEADDADDADDDDENTDDDYAKEEEAAAAEEVVLGADGLESPFDWEAMSAADDDDDGDGGDYDMPPRLVTFVYLQACPTNPNTSPGPGP